jgi:2-polyprenyl-6-methoxyphenol hydroxylase-like FAD-dependent oxidoreductase
MVFAVESSRVPTWHQPGLLLIGDAAHVMSPIGGVGINFSMQDATEAANLLAQPLSDGAVTDAQLAQAQQRREPAVKLIQRFQGLVQDHVVRSGLTGDHLFRLPLPARVMLRLPWLRDLPAKLIAFGIRRARLEG